MTIISMIGLLAAALTTISFLPQAIKTIKEKDTGSISLGMYSLFTTGVLLWLIYGISIMDIPIIAANLVTFALASFILGMKLKYK
ncbi:SemiSWEET transporter [Salipaludibacillus sp. HK11]|uniref:SemiSWEET transporter n=1 Tax=Salipaludibacillus sp. HK11 TaxID=3394320 RepID=UPI0039FBA310